jgi:spore germination cell wall hydrolase CwlJ-like protein
MKNVGILALVLLPTAIALAIQNKPTDEPAIKPIVYALPDKPVIKTAKLNAILPDQTTCLAEALYHEARGEGETGMIAVANVVINRVKHDAFPNDPCSVIHQPSQFSFVGVNNTIEEPELYGKAEQLAKKALKNKLPKVVSNDVIYYWNPDKVNLKKHQWIARVEPVKKIGKHQFAKDKS